VVYNLDTRIGPGVRSIGGLQVHEGCRGVGPLPGLVREWQDGPSLAQVQRCLRLTVRSSLEV